MMKIGAAALLALLIVPHVPSPATAENSLAGNMHMQMMLMRMLNARQAVNPESVNPNSTASRSGTIVVKVNVTKKTAFTGTLRCGVTITHSNPFYPATYLLNQFAPVKFSGANGSCTLTMPYSWAHADTTQKIEVSLQLFSEVCGCSTTSIDVDSVWSDQSGPLPANGATTTFTFSKLVI
jgi:hypothetical protein